MKKYIRILAVMLIMFALTLMGCEPVVNNSNVNITTVQSKITLNVDEVLDFDYKSLFVINDGTSFIEVKDEYLDLSNILALEGTYYVICTYQNKIASVNVENSKSVILKTVTFQNESTKLRKRISFFTDKSAISETLAFIFGYTSIVLSLSGRLTSGLKGRFKTFSH